MKANIKSFRNFKKRLSESVLKDSELIDIRGGGEPDVPPIIVPV